MHVVVYAHSLVSDWNHGNAHFLRGVLSELQARGHTTAGREPADGWSRANLLADQGQPALDRFAVDFPELSCGTYQGLEGHEDAVAAADVVIVHEWTEPSLIAHLGRLRRSSGRFKLLFHDTHHRGVSDQEAMADLVLTDYDAVLVFGASLRSRYRRLGWNERVFVWHEAADMRRCRPMSGNVTESLVWIGNWGDGERARELEEFLIEPARALGLSGSVRGVRYPQAARARLATTNLIHGGWIANADVPLAFGRHAMTIHVPRRPYVEALPGIPTIRMFEALACGIPLVSAPWEDSEGLFRTNTDYLSARDGNEMIRHLAALRDDRGLRESLAANGRETILARHTCAHRVDELLAILASL